MSEFKSNLRRLALEQQAQSLQLRLHNASSDVEKRQLHNKLTAVKKTLLKLTQSLPLDV